ncbi:MIF domain-containing protein [Zalerion maritima]|uniref:L-dopachrome isomerase n=1 Tax=Zalerion maritima TaxID=339359 RepID=A0AAD5RKC1_9PEZI|nr:MIF domain-containing protein [Zalerion maritima]
MLPRLRPAYLHNWHRAIRPTQPIPAFSRVGAARAWSQITALGAVQRNTPKAPHRPDGALAAAKKASSGCNYRIIGASDTVLRQGWQSGIFPDPTSQEFKASFKTRSLPALVLSSSTANIPPEQTEAHETPAAKSRDQHHPRRTTATVIAPHNLKKVPSNPLALLSPVSPAMPMAPQARPDHMRPITRPPPEDPGAGNPVRGSVSKNPRQSRDFTSKKLSWFETSFNEKTPDSVKQQVEGEAMVSAEVRTNVIIKDEFTFITDLSYQLAERFQRSITSIVVAVQHGTCMLYGGTFDPAYVFNITTLETAFSATVNKRNSALIQAHMEESLGVAPARGLINFIGIKTDCTATNGKTVLGMLDEATRNMSMSSASGGLAPGRPGTSSSERRRSHKLSRCPASGLCRAHNGGQTTFGANLEMLSTLGLGTFTPPATPSDGKFPHSPTSPGGMEVVTEEAEEELASGGGSKDG